jgi:hypothetical protein
MSVQQLASVIATAVKTATSTIGMAEKGIISGGTVVTTHGVYKIASACPINLYDGRQVWVQVTDDGKTAVVIGG